MKIRKSVIVAAGALALTTCFGTDLKWIGGTDNNLATGANWEGGSAAALTASGGCTIDLSAVADGTTLVNNLGGTLFLTGVKMAANQGTVTLSGGNSCLVNAAFALPTGATLDYACNVPNSWYWGNRAMTVSGGGALRISAAQFWFYDSTFTVGAGSTLDLARSLGVSTGLSMSRIILADATARLKLSADAQVNTVCVADNSAPNIDLGGHTLTLTGGNDGGYLPSAWCDKTLTAALGGGGGLTLTGAGAIHPISGSLAGLDRLTIGGAVVELGADTSLPASATLAVIAHGELRLHASQTVAALSGTSVAGGIDVPEGKALTVDGASDSAYSNRLSGVGQLIKKGAGTLTLAGETTLAGGVSVEAGTVRLAEPHIWRSDIATRYDFEDENNLARDSVSGKAWYVATPSVYSRVPGLSGMAVHSEYCLSPELHAAGTESYIQIPRSETIHGLANQPFTVSLWMRPDNVTSNLVGWGSMREIFFLGTWGNYQNLRLWMNGNDKLVFSSSAWTASIDYGYSAVASGMTARAQDGQWHHVAGVYADKVLKLYVDGRLAATKDLSSVVTVWAPDGVKILSNNNDGVYAFGGDLDEIITSKTAWTDEDVLAEYNRRSPFVSVALPPLAARWTFDEVVNGQIPDVGPNGYNLKARTVTAGDHLHAPSDVFGKAYRGWQDDWSLRLADGADFPAKFPTGNAAWTISVRCTSGPENVPIIQWGDMGTARRHVKIQLLSNPRQIGCDASDGPWAVMDGMSLTTSGSSARPFTHCIFSYDPTRQTIRQWRDGRFIYEYGTGGALDVPASGFYIQSATVNGTMGYYGYIDDIAVYNGAFTDAQARQLTETLKNGVRGTLGADVPVSVSAGATLQLAGAGHAVNLAAGEGTVSVSAGDTLTLTHASAFAGEIAGDGVVSLGSGGALPAATVRTDALLQSGATFAMTALPVVTTAKRLVVPASGTVDLSGTAPQGGKYVIARGAYVAADDVSGWSVTGANAGDYKVRFGVADGAFTMTLKTPGLKVIVR